ncbi:acetylglutamate kinase [Robertmurraya siralis]|uniref:Acetylglutamate kinase n=1 Tax=Robertmurraya siralis TaxID=77777 RepID=A0A920BUH3_9BACI|nr:acetylglutamate kinase [Robertmurraya siralis]PAE20640.1 acetylglutamate kinase [Bacillus sp. 7504-2]GIN62943.1 acetylglutamate kinase [Robertmurraya siralis]
MKIILIKCGGSTLEELSAEFFKSLQELKKQNYRIVIIHGGGPDINQMLGQLNVQAEYVNGLRKTTAEILEVVELVLAGKTNRRLVHMLESHKLSALGLNGSDAGLLKGCYLNKEELGYVGEITEVNGELIDSILAQGIIPVITPIAITNAGIKLNVNADYAAAAVANALKVEQCLFVTDVEGIMVNGAVQEILPAEEVENLIASGEIYGGMIPKVTSALSVLQKGIESVRIVTGKKKIYQNEQWFGTKILGKERLCK